jgi:hypothetical protein
MEVGQGPNWGCSAKKRLSIYNFKELQTEEAELKQKKNRAKTHNTELKH